MYESPSIVRQARHFASGSAGNEMSRSWIEALADALDDVVTHGRAMLSPDVCERHGMGAKGVNCGLCQDDFEIALDSIDGYLP